VTVVAPRPDRELLNLLADDTRRLAGEKQLIFDAQADQIRHQQAHSFELGAELEGIGFTFGFGIRLGIIVDDLGGAGFIIGLKSKSCCGLGAAAGVYAGANRGSMYAQRGARTVLDVTAAVPAGGAGVSMDLEGRGSVRGSLMGPGLLLSAGPDTLQQGIIGLWGAPPRTEPPPAPRPHGLNPER